MLTDHIRGCLGEEDIDFLAVPPGFESFTYSKSIEDTDRKFNSSVPCVFPEQPVHMKTEKKHADVGKISRSLRRRPWVNYGQYGDDWEDEFDSEWPDQNLQSNSSLPRGVIRGCSECQHCQKVVARWRPEAARRPVLEEVPVFFPSEKEFADTLGYIAKIRPEAEPYGICRIVPPTSWRFHSCLNEKSLWGNSNFATKVQRVDQLQNRDPAKKVSKILKHAKRKRRRCSNTGFDCEAGIGGNLNHIETEFGFGTGPDCTLASFERYADDFKTQYFRSKDNAVASEFDKLELSVETMEGEYWRVVEKPTDEIEVLYGADLETGVFGSGFPKVSGEDCSPSEEKILKSGWNLNNLPRLPGSVLSYESAGISGVQVPWLYIGMCFSSFCWHVEDHHFYSLNYMHFGAPKIWYGVPGEAATKFEEATRKHLPDLFEEQPDLLHKLVTQLSPTILKSEGVPVYRCIQSPGEFVMTFPRAYHCGFNCGFNCAEAVNVAPLDWIPHGQTAVELYHEQRRKTTISHDKLLLGAAREAVKANWELNLLKKKSPDNLRWKDACGSNGILAKSLRQRVEMERVRREFLCRSSKALKMDSSFDATSERECCVCFFDLHLSAAGCNCSPDRFACLNHAKELCPCSQDDKFFLFRYEISELNLLIDAVEGKLSSVYRWARHHLGLSLSSYVNKESAQVSGCGGSSQKSGEVITNSRPSTCRGEESYPETLTNLTLDTGSSHLQFARKDGSCSQGFDIGNLEFTSGQYNLICPSDKEGDEPLSDETKAFDTFVDAGLKLNISNKGSADNEAPGGGGDLIISSDGDKSIDLSGPLSAEDIKYPKSGTFPLSNQQNLCTNPALASSSTGRNVLDYSFSESSSQNGLLSSAVGGQLGLKDEDETMVQKGDVRVDDVRAIPGSHCNQNNMDSGYPLKGPCIAKAVRRINCNVEPLNFGIVLPGNSWSNSWAIFPKGFKSRARYISIANPANMCYYISEILDGGPRGPLFMVSVEDCPHEVFVNASPTRCWEMVRERVNLEIAKQHKMGRPNLPPLQPLKSLDGLEMFGFTSPAIIQGIEALDKNLMCTPYWNSRPLAHISHGFQSPTPHSREDETSATNIQPTPGVHSILQGLFKKADMVELHSLSEILGEDGAAATNYGLVIRLLKEEIGKRSRYCGTLS